MLAILLLIVPVLSMSCTSDNGGESPQTQGTPRNEDPMPEVTDEPVTQPESLADKVSVSIELTQYLEADQITTDDGEVLDVPASMLFTAHAINPITPPGEKYSVNMVYKALLPTGLKTYMLIDPMNPDSGYVSDDNGPITYNVVSGEEERLENYATEPDSTMQFYIEQPMDAVSVEYWAEIVIQSDLGETVLTSYPYVLIDDVSAQGGPIEPDA